MRFSGRGRSSLDSQKSIEWRAMSSNGISGSHSSHAGSASPRICAPCDLRAHLDQAERIVPVVGAEIEIAEASVFWNTVSLGSRISAIRIDWLWRM